MQTAACPGVNEGGNDLGVVMGVYHRNLYETASGAALRSELAEYLALSGSLDATIERLRKRYEVGYVPLTADGANFWLALADQLHGFGQTHEVAFRIARGLIDNGDALRLYKDAGYDDETLRRQARTLRNLRQKWDTPPKRLRKLPSLKPEPFLMAPGEVYTYATAGGNPRHPDQIGKRGHGAFRSEAQNAFVCFNTARVFFDIEARYFVIPLAIFSRDTPITLEQAVRAQLITHCELDRRSFTPLGGWMAMDRKRLEALAPKKIGQVDPLPSALERLFGQSVYAPLSRSDGPKDPLQMNFGVLSNIVRAHVWGGDEDRLEAFVKAWTTL